MLVPVPVVQPHILVIMGLPLYGRTWQLKSPTDNRIGAPAIVIGLGHNGVSMHDKRTIDLFIYWNQLDWVRKVEFAREQGLHIFFLWAL